jgi:hypothetical protein
MNDNPKAYDLNFNRVIIELDRIASQMNERNLVESARRMGELLAYGDRDRWWSHEGASVPPLARVADLVFALEVPGEWLPDWTDPEQMAVARGETSLSGPDREAWIASRRLEHLSELKSTIGSLLVNAE